jgi:hypothetical protein
MDAKTVVHSAIYRGATERGVNSRRAKRAATAGVDCWRKNKFKTVSKMIDEKIKEAVNHQKAWGKKKIT